MPFLNELQNLSKKYDFDDFSVDTMIINQNIRDQFILGLQSDDLTRNLSEESIFGMVVLSHFKAIPLNDRGLELVMSVLPSVLKEFDDLFDHLIKNSCVPTDNRTIIKLHPHSQPFQAKVRKYCEFSGIGLYMILTFCFLS